MKMQHQSQRRRWLLGSLLGMCLLLMVGLAHRGYQARQRSHNVLAEVYKSGMYAAHRPAFHFSERVFDFGTATAGALVEHTYAFTNTGDRPLIIHTVIGGCSGCVTAAWHKQPIQPGAQGEIKVKLNTTDQLGAQAQVIVIRANTDPPEARLLLKGVIKPLHSPCP